MRVSATCLLFLSLTVISGLRPAMVLAQAGAPAGPIPQWIWSGEVPRRNQTVVFRNSFFVEPKLLKAELRGLADDSMTVAIDGRQAALIESSKEMVAIDVTGLLRPGENVIVAQATNRSGAGGVLIRLQLHYPDGRQESVVTDQTWLAKDLSTPRKAGAADDGRNGSAAVSLGQPGIQPWGEPTGDIEDYNQWKQALGTGTATDASKLLVVPGFQVELLRSASEGEGSWISLTFDHKGRLILGREGKGLLRLTLHNDPAQIAVETINETLEECRGLLYAFDSLYANANNSKALYRLRDTDGDDRFDDIQLLRKTEGGVGHGRNGIALGPDNMLYLIHGNNVKLPDDYTAAGSPLIHLAEDRLRNCFWDQFLFDYGVKVPAGHVIRTDPEGKKWELVAGAFRNPYGIDFNADGEMFTYDADNEGDIGLPWYRPTRINHIVSGGDYGFRQGSANRPADYPDSLPSNLNIGLGSPTGVKFGTRSNFPAPYQQALFVLDWAYGKVYAVHLLPQGASYNCRAEKFIEGRPLNVTDLAFGPDGAMYFTTGGRRTQSGLYRVRALGTAKPTTNFGTSASKAELQWAAEKRSQRRQLEKLHTGNSTAAIPFAWPFLANSDPWLRYTARIAIEHQPVADWQEHALAATEPTAALTILLGLARMGSADLQPRILARLENFPLGNLSPEQQLISLRVAALCLIRIGKSALAQTGQLAARLDSSYPGDYPLINQKLCELLVTLDSPHVVAKTIPLLKEAGTQEERLFYLFNLRNVKTGWTPPDRQIYFHALREADDFTGGYSLAVAVNAIRDEASAWLNDAEREAVADLLVADFSSSGRESAPSEPRSFVKEWVAADLSEVLEAVGTGRDFERGKRLYDAALCSRCHRFAGRGAAVGPELTAVGNRFNRRDLLESIVNPSKVIDEKYKQVQLVTQNGLTIVGRPIGGDETTLVVATQPLDPRQVSKIVRAEIESQSASPLSPMPLGLLNTLTQDEILDLLAYLQSAGDAKHANFKK